MQFLRIFIYGFAFFHCLMFITLHIPLSEFVKNSSLYLFSLAGGASFLASAISLGVLKNFYLDLFGASK